MPDETSGENPTRNSNNQSPLPSLTESPIEQRIVAVERNPSADAKQQKSEDLVSAVKTGELWLIAINGSLLIATIVIACIYYGQLTEMREATEASTKASNTAAETLSNTIEQFRIDERAWIAIERVERISVGPSFRYKLYPKNLGKTAAHSIVVSAARNMQGSISIGSDAVGMSRLQDKTIVSKHPPIPLENPGPKTLAPGATAINPFVIDGQAPLWDGRWVSYLIGRIDYADDFGIKHWTKFCFYVGEANGELWNCTEGNDEDSNPEIRPQVEASHERQ